MRSVISGVYNLLLGMSITARVFARRRVTVQYPYERVRIPERSRGMVVLLSDPETGDLNCTACLLCEKACPVAAIDIERVQGPDKRFHPTKFTVDATICAYCGLCEEACNFYAIKLANEFEFASYSKEEHFHDVAWLQEHGRHVLYDKPVKPPKPAPAPEAAAKPAEKRPLTEEEKEELRRKAREKKAQQDAGGDEG